MTKRKMMGKPSLSIMEKIKKIIRMKKFLKEDRVEKRTRITFPLSELITCTRCNTRWKNDMIICEKCGTELHIPWVVIPHGDMHMGKKRVSRKMRNL